MKSKTSEIEHRTSVEIQQEIDARNEQIRALRASIAEDRKIKRRVERAEARERERIAREEFERNAVVFYETLQDRILTLSNGTKISGLDYVKDVVIPKLEQAENEAVDEVQTDEAGQAVIDENQTEEAQQEA